MNKATFTPGIKKNFTINGLDPKTGTPHADFKTTNRAAYNADPTTPKTTLISQRKLSCCEKFIVYSLAVAILAGVIVGPLATGLLSLWLQDY